MQLRFFTIPAMDGEEAEEALNLFLRSHKVVSVEKEFCCHSNPPFWSCCVTVVDQILRHPSKTDVSSQQVSKQAKVDYREVLDDTTFAVFSKLRELRKQIAVSDGVPVYAVFSNQELADIAKLETIDEKSLKTIQGIGEGRIEKYGAKFCNMYKAETDNSTATNSVSATSL